MEIIFGGIMGNLNQYVKGNHGQRPLKIFDIVRKIIPLTDIVK